MVGPSGLHSRVFSVLYYCEKGFLLKIDAATRCKLVKQQFSAKSFPHNIKGLRDQPYGVQVVKLTTFLCSTAFVHFRYPEIIRGKESILCYKELSALPYVLVKWFSLLQYCILSV